MNGDESGASGRTVSQASLELGVTGNGTIAALIDETGACVWLCLPRLDGEPVFDALVGGQGAFTVELRGRTEASQRYIGNTGVIETELESEDGSAIRIVDFTPVFTDRERTFRPASFVRRITPLRGMPRVRIALRASAGRGSRSIPPRRGISHIRFEDGEVDFRVTTDAPVSFVMDAREHVLDREVSFILGPDEPLQGVVDLVARDWLERTQMHWQDWARRLATPPEWQDAVIRAAITLKMCVYEETGGIVAALTTSIPEHEGSQRNWDYRYCWLRDAYFTVSALNRLSAMSTLEHYLAYLRNIVAQTDGGHIQPVYGVALEPQLTETIAAALPGYRGHRPVRFGNQAAEHVQHDVYGHIILGASQAFFDRRLYADPGMLVYRQLERVGERAYAVYDTPDAGIWEYRGRAEVHTSSAIMCWAACDRLAKIALRLGLPERVALWRGRAEEIAEVVLEKAWSERRQAFTGAYGGDDLDASALLMAEINFIDPRDPRFVATVERIDAELREGAHVFRYRRADDFGPPKTAFTACTFWHVDALARIGRREEARALFDDILAHRTRLGLLSEDIDVESGELWGNFPQTYCMVGVVNAAARLSRTWESLV